MFSVRRSMFLSRHVFAQCPYERPQRGRRTKPRVGRVCEAYPGYSPKQIPPFRAQRGERSEYIGHAASNFDNTNLVIPSRRRPLFGSRIVAVDMPPHQSCGKITVDHLMRRILPIMHPKFNLPLASRRSLGEGVLRSTFFLPPLTPTPPDKTHSLRSPANPLIAPSHHPSTLRQPKSNSHP